MTEILIFLGVLLEIIINLLDNLLDASSRFQVGFQNPASSQMEEIIKFHNFIMFFLIIVLVMVMTVIQTSMKGFNYRDLKKIRESLYPKTNREMLTDCKEDRRYVCNSNIKFSHDSPLEIIWTLLPALVLMVIAVPSFGLLYSIEETLRPEVTLKVVGHQWYWSYEFPEFPDDEEGVRIIDSGNMDNLTSLNNTEKVSIVENTKNPEELMAVIVDLSKSTPYGFDSYMLQEDDLSSGMLRLLEVDKRILLPYKTHIRVIITSADVLHSWAVPSLGVKVDACPGRLNQAAMFIKRQGMFFGQCSEICGVNHGFMPIAIRSTNKLDFFNSVMSNVLNNN